MANILICGGGFGGLGVAEHLADALDSSHQVTLVSPSREFTFYPALVQLAFDKCEPEDITFDLPNRLGELGVRYIQGEVTGLHPDRKAATIAGPDFNGEIAYDYLVVAVGRRLATERVKGFFEYAHHLLGISAAQKFGNAVKTFRAGNIVVGLCPGAQLPVAVCETAFALAKKFEKELLADQVRIKVIFPESLEKAFGGASLHKELEAAFAHQKINVLYDVPITEITFDEVISANKHRIAYDLTMLVPPFRGQAMFRKHGITDNDDFVKVDGEMRVYGLESAYAVGDIVAFSGPKFAHMALQQALVAGTNLASDIKGLNERVEYYHEIATIIDAGGSDSIYLHYGVWDDALYRLRKGRFWGWMKQAHDVYWRTMHK